MGVKGLKHHLCKLGKVNMEEKTSGGKPDAVLRDEVSVIDQHSISISHLLGGAERGRGGEGRVGCDKYRQLWAVKLPLHNL